MCSRPGDFSSAINPAAAITPACRIPPPNIFRYTRPFSINAHVPTTIDPTGAPNPFDKQNIAESTLRVIVATLSPSTVSAFEILSPSMCTFNTTPPTNNLPPRDSKQAAVRTTPKPFNASTPRLHHTLRPRSRQSHFIANQIHPPASSPSPIQLHTNIRPSLRTHVTLLLGSFS